MSKLRARAAVMVATGVLFATPATAQEASNGSDRVPPGPIDHAGAIAGQRVQVEAGTADGSASISFALPDNRSSSTSDGITRYSTDTFNVIVSTPWNGEDDAEPATLDGLANGTRFTFRWGRHVGFLNANRTPGMRALEAEARQACRAKAIETYDARLSAAEHAIPDASDPQALERRRRLLVEERDQSFDACAFPQGGYGNLINQHLRARSLEYISMFRPRGSYEFGLEASIGRNGFEYVDPATLAELQDTKTQWSARAFVAFYPVGSSTAFTLSAGYERAYEAADEAVLCPPNPNNLVTQCVTAAAGPPELNESALIAAGLRHRFRGGPLAGVAVAPLVTYDAVDDVVGVDLPVYFIPDSDGGLIGGVRFGYRSDRDDAFSVGIFIGAAFNILN